MNVKNGIRNLTLFGFLLCLTSAYSMKGVRKITVKLTSNAFEHQSGIPKQFTCVGTDVSPQLSWSDVPAKTKSLVLIVDDPDAPDPAAPKLTWVHWLLYNIPPQIRELPENQSSATLPKGALPGLNDWHQPEYRGPCPPIGRHRYFFKLYALNKVLPDLNSPNKTQLEKAMVGHIIGQGELIGTYQH